MLPRHRGDPSDVHHVLGSLFACPQRWGEVTANLMPFELVIDEDILLAHPIDPIVAGTSADIDLLIENNAEEYRLFMIPNGALNAITEDILSTTIAIYGLPVETRTTYQARSPEARRASTTRRQASTESRGKNSIHFLLCSCYVSGKDQPHGIFCHTANYSRPFLLQNLISFSDAGSYVLGVYVFK